MKQILIIHSNMEMGGAETSLLGLLNSFDYSKVQVDLFLYECRGEFLPLVPESVKILDEEKNYKALVSPIRQTVQDGKLFIAAERILSKLIWKLCGNESRYSDPGYVLKQVYHKNALPFLPTIKGHYDLAISFNDPHYILHRKVDATVKLGWFHTDFSRISVEETMERQMWNECNYAVCVSESCKDAFVKKHPYMEQKTQVIENILSAELIWNKAQIDVRDEMPDDGTIKLLSIGRFCEAKNFDNIPQICKLIQGTGLSVKWYLIGFGNDEELIRQRINEQRMQSSVLILGKKDNPYPYIRECDLYVQPSRYEGKCVAVREAQILHKPVVIANYSTAFSQLKDGYDGVVVPQDNEGCAAGIAKLLQDKELLRRLSENTRQCDYTNSEQVQKLYQMME